MPQRRYNEHSATLTANTFDLQPNPARRAVIISNNSDTDMTWRVGAEADATHGIVLKTGYPPIVLDGDLCPEGLVSLYCAGTGKAFTVYEVVG